MSLKNTPMGRFDWERVIARAELPSITKAVAMFIAMRANMDGSSAHPGERWLADVLGKTERYIRDQIDLLRDLGLIERTAFGRVNEGFDTYQLTVPGAADIPLRMRLNPDGHRYTPRPEPKPRPRKAKTDADATGSPLPEAGPDTDTATGSPLPVDGPTVPAATGNPLPEAGRPDEVATGSGLPVDNSGYRNQVSGSGTPDEDHGSRATGNLVQSYRKPGANLPEASFRQGDPYQPSTNTGSPKATDSPGETIKPVDNGEQDDPTRPASGPPTAQPTATPRAASFGASVLDGTDPSWMTQEHADAELAEARRIVDAINDREPWLTAGRDVLERKHLAVTVPTLAIVTAELYRRALALASTPNGES